MQSISENNKRIAKNTIMLYIRMLLIMAVTLYTSRVVLEVLGVEDFGIYNVVGGLVAMFSFLTGSLSASTQRYITYALGKGNREELRIIFSTSIYIHILFSILIILLSETLGLWFFYTKLQIPIDRLDATFWAFQFSILSAAIAVLNIPFYASIVAYERMNIFAYISVAEAILKLVVVYILLLFDIDKLALYAFLIFFVQFVVWLSYILYCRHHFELLRLKKVYNRGLFNEMLRFSGWNLFGSLASVCFNQGLNILLNVFFNPIVNAARAISVQVQNAVYQFCVGFQTALNPQITKSYASKDYTYMYSLLFQGSKFSFYLLLLFSLPVFIEADVILYLWLKNVPENTVIFLRIMLVISWINSFSNPLIVAASATGKIMRYQILVGGILLLVLPISYIFLVFGAAPFVVFVVHLCVELIAQLARLFLLRGMIQLPLIDYWKKVILKSLLVLCVSIIIPFSLYNYLNSTLFDALIICIVTIISTVLSIYFFGISYDERALLKKKCGAYIKYLCK